MWLAAAVAQVAGDCDVECGDRDRGYFLLVMVTAPLIPAGLALLARSGADRRPLVTLGRAACAAVAGVFVLIGLGLVAGGIGAFVDLIQEDYPVNLDDPEGSRQGAVIDVVIWLVAAGWAFGVALATALVGRRLRRRYPSRPWPPSDRSTSAG